MKQLCIALLGSLAFLGCEQPNSTVNDRPVDSTTTRPLDTTTTRPMDTATGTSSTTPRTADRDNTAVNVRDRNPDAKTPLDQNENKVDIGITAAIRKSVVDTKMSTNAQNVKIITQDGKVTLRGPVKTADEKKMIEDIARNVAGVKAVDSQLEVE